MNSKYQTIINQKSLDNKYDPILLKSKCIYKVIARNYNKCDTPDAYLVDCDNKYIRDECCLLGITIDPNGICKLFMYDESYAAMNFCDEGKFIDKYRNKRFKYNKIRLYANVPNYNIKSDMDVSTLKYEYKNNVYTLEQLFEYMYNKHISKRIYSNSVMWCIGTLFREFYKHNIPTNDNYQYNWYKDNIDNEVQYSNITNNSLFPIPSWLSIIMVGVFAIYIGFAIDKSNETLFNINYVPSIAFFVTLIYHSLIIDHQSLRSYICNNYKPLINRKIITI